MDRLVRDRGEPRAGHRKRRFYMARPSRWGIGVSARDPGAIAKFLEGAAGGSLLLPHWRGWWFGARCHHTLLVRHCRARLFGVNGTVIFPGTGKVKFPTLGFRGWAAGHLHFLAVGRGVVARPVLAA